MNSQNEIYNDIHEAREIAIKQNNTNTGKKGYRYGCSENFDDEGTYNYCDVNNPIMP